MGASAVVRTTARAPSLGVRPPSGAWARREAGVAPGEEAPVEVGRAVQAGAARRGRGEARRVALGAGADPLDVGVAALRDTSVAGGVEPPLQVVALDDQDVLVIGE